MTRWVLAAALLAASCIPPAPCSAGRPRLELACTQIARVIESDICGGALPCQESDEYLTDCLRAADAQVRACAPKDTRP